MKGVYVPLNTEERKALAKLGEIERRDPRQQAALIIRKTLEQLRLLRPLISEGECHAKNSNSSG